MNRKTKDKKRIFSAFVSLTLAVSAGCAGGGQAFSLTTNFNEYANEELNETLFDEIISGFDSDIWDFMTLSPEKPITGSTFLQVGAPQEIADFQYTLEIGFFDEKSGLKMYRLYSEDRNAVSQIFVDYWREQKIPDISLWEDVSAEMRR